MSTNYFRTKNAKCGSKGINKTISVITSAVPAWFLARGRVRSENSYGTLIFVFTLFTQIGR